MQGRYVSFTAPGEVALEAYEVGDIAPHEILVETIYSIVSPGTERANFQAEFNTETVRNGFPFRPGYSNLGQVIRVGADVRNIRRGQLVATMKGHQSHAIVRPPLYGPRQRVAQTHFGATNVADLSWRIPDGLDRTRLRCCAAFIIFTVGLYGLRRSCVAIGDQVIIIGLGPIGLSAGQFARLSGALPVIGVARSPERRRIAEQVGFDRVYPSIAQLQEDFSDYAGAAGTTVIDATGQPTTVLSALKACPEGAQFVLLGCTRGLVSEVDFYSQIHRKALTVIGAHQPTRPSPDYLHGQWMQYWDADTVLRMILSKRIQSEDVITNEFNIDDFKSAYQVVRDSPDALCVALRWD